jgi:hypothetical protein
MLSKYRRSTSNRVKLADDFLIFEVVFFSKKKRRQRRCSETSFSFRAHEAMEFLREMSCGCS